MRIGLIVAMNKEFCAIADSWKSKDIERHHIMEKNGCRYMLLQPTDTDEVIMLQCGIGKVNGAIGAMSLIGLGVDCIISSGVAGGLVRQCVPGTVVVGTDSQYHDGYCGDGNEPGQIQGDPAIYKANKELLDIALAKGSQNIHFGQILTGDWFVDTEGKALEIKKQYPLSYALDMESCAIAQVCNKWNIPFLSYRVISDNILNPSTISYDMFWDEMPRKISQFTMQYIMHVLREYKPF